MKKFGAPSNYAPKVLNSIEFESIPLDSARLDTIFDNLPPEDQQRYFAARDSIIQARASAPLNEGSYWIIN